MYPDKEAKLLSAFSPSDPIYTLDTDYIKRARSLSRQEGSPCAEALKALLERADAALKQTPVTVVHKSALPSSNDKHDYTSTDRPLLEILVATVRTLGFAYRFTQREACATHASLLLRTWFLNPETRMNPNLQFSRAVPSLGEGQGRGLFETAGFAREMLPAVSFLGASEAWSDEDTTGLQSWFHTFLGWMMTHPHGKEEAHRGDHHSTAYDVQLVAYAFFIGQSDLARRILQDVGERRIASQIEPDGSQPLELEHTQSIESASLNLRYLLELAEIGRQWGIDLINFESDGRSIRRAFDWLHPHWTSDHREWAFECGRLAAYHYLSMDFEPVKAELSGMDQAEKTEQIYNLTVPPFEGSGLHALPIGEDVVLRDPDPLFDPDFTNGDPTLSEAEVAFFKEKGFLVKRGLLDETETFARIVDYVWENVPRDIVKREDPETWIDAPQEEWTAADAENLGHFRRGSWKMRSRTIGTESFFVDKIANHPRMRQLVTAFIGGPLKRANRVRGVYCTFPKSPDREGRLAPHGDHTGAQLSAMVFVDTVPPHCGGFTIWPGSHHMSHAYHTTVHGPLDPDRADQYVKDRDDVLRKVSPVSFQGKAGDVVFWHPRLVHGPGVNYSADHERPVVRYIVPCEYQKDGLTSYFNLSHGPAPNRQWWVDTKNFREDVPATEDNVWDGWAFTSGT